MKTKKTRLYVYMRQIDVFRSEQNSMGYEYVSQLSSQFTRCAWSHMRTLHQAKAFYTQKTRIEKKEKKTHSQTWSYTLKHTYTHIHTATHIISSGSHSLCAFFRGNKRESLSYRLVPSYICHMMNERMHGHYFWFSLFGHWFVSWI